MRGHVRFAIYVIALILAVAIPSSGGKVKFGRGKAVYTGGQDVALDKPEDVACGHKSVVIADTGNGRLLKFPFSDTAGKESLEISVPELPYPIKVSVNSRGDIFAIDGRRHRIVHINPMGAFSGYIELKGTSRSRKVIPKSVRVDREDNIYVLDISGGRVIILDPRGIYKEEIKFPRTYGFISDLTVDGRGTILLVDSVKRAVYRAAKGDRAFALLTGNLEEEVRFPVAITTDKQGLIYVVDENGGDIVVLSPDGSFLGKKFKRGHDEGFLSYPSGVCVGDRGTIFIADRENSRIQEFPREE